MTTEAVINLAKSIGFSHAGKVNIAELKFLPEVRDMCASNRCQSYGKSWVCPPACGSLEEITQKAQQYHRGVLVQTTAQMEDDFDLETMMEAEQHQKEHFYALVDALREDFPQLLPMSCGTCTLCKSCSYPDAPCRFPNKAFTSMEAYGLMVSDVCKQSGLGYYYGPQTITYTSCILLD